MGRQYNLKVYYFSKKILLIIVSGKFIAVNTCLDS